MFDWIDAKWGELIPIIIISSGVGTLWRTLTSPKDSLAGLAKQAALALTVGAVAGGGLVQYYNLSGLMAALVISASAFLGEHILDFLELYGKKLRKGKVDLIPKGDA